MLVVLLSKKSPLSDLFAPHISFLLVLSYGDSCKKLCSVFDILIFLHNCLACIFQKKHLELKMSEFQSGNSYAMRHRQS